MDIHEEDGLIIADCILRGLTLMDVYSEKSVRAAILRLERARDDAEFEGELALATALNSVLTYAYLQAKGG
jgi:hypothetical protein